MKELKRYTEFLQQQYGVNIDFELVFKDYKNSYEDAGKHGLIETLDDAIGYTLQDYTEFIDHQRLDKDLNYFIDKLLIP